MTRDELIAEARKHTKNLAHESGHPWATLETLPKVTVVDAVEVLFESEQLPHKKMVVVLERESGNCILTSVAFRECK